MLVEPPSALCLKAPLVSSRLLTYNRQESLPGVAATKDKRFLVYWTQHHGRTHTGEAHRILPSLPPSHRTDRQTMDRCDRARPYLRAAPIQRDTVGGSGSFRSPVGGAAARA